MHGQVASSASDCVALQDGPVKGAPSRRVAKAMAQAPPLTVPPFRAVFRQLSDEAPLRLGQVAGRSRRDARSARTPVSHLQAVTQLVSSPPTAQLTRPDAVMAGLTPKRPRRRVENDDYVAFVRRILRAYSRRVGDGDVEALALMLGLVEEIDTAIAEAVKSLRVTSNVHSLHYSIRTYPGLRRGDHMALAQLIVSSAIALIIAGAGWYAASSYRMQTRIKLLELRVEAYRRLFEITEVASPTRLDRSEQLSREEAAKLGRSLYNWYYENGNGLLMPNSTRIHLQNLQQKLQGEPLRRQSSDPVLAEVSNLRSLLRRDVGVFAKGEAGGAWPETIRYRWPWMRHDSGKALDSQADEAKVDG